MRKPRQGNDAGRSVSQSYLPVCSMYTHVHRVAAGAATIRMDILALSGLFLRYSAGSSIMCSICQSAPARTRTCMKAVQKPGGLILLHLPLLLKKRLLILSSISTIRLECPGFTLQQVLHIRCTYAATVPTSPLPSGEGARVRADAGPAMMEPGRGVVPPCGQVVPSDPARRESRAGFISEKSMKGAG